MSNICSAPGDDSEVAVMKSCAVNRASLIYPSEQMSSRNRRRGAPTMLAANADHSDHYFIITPIFWGFYSAVKLDICSLLEPLVDTRGPAISYLTLTVIYCIFKTPLCAVALSPNPV